jgi:hypothetical protein
MDAQTSLAQPSIAKPRQALPIKATPATGWATADDFPVLHAAIWLAQQIRSASDEIERGRRITPGIAAAMKDAGVFGMAMPRVWGDPGLDPLTQYRVIEVLAIADSSVGWCVMIGCDGGYVTAFLDQDIARAMYPDILVATGGHSPSRISRSRWIRRYGRSSDLVPHGGAGPMVVHENIGLIRQLLETAASKVSWAGKALISVIPSASWHLGPRVFTPFPAN